jgi:rare lipoprotein A
MRMRLPNSIRLSLALLVASTPALAKQTQDSQHHPAPDLKTKPAKATATATKTSAKQHHAAGRVAIRSGHGSGRVRSTTAELPPPDRYLGPVHVVGRREVGSAAWYGGRHIGMRTASGDRLDALRVTAAHRSLPLNSLVRVTNLGNGRSVIAKINDRGPYSHSLLIDVSPRAAQELDMIHSGIATVAIEPVAPAADPPHQ